MAESILAYISGTGFSWNMEFVQEYKKQHSLLLQKKSEKKYWLNFPLNLKSLVNVWQDWGDVSFLAREKKEVGDCWYTFTVWV